MYFQLREVILWPRDTSLPPRRLTFEAGMINVISGASRTGKSAIIPIIDYCLGTDKCAIPVNVIRNSCSWFGVIIDTVVGQKLLARREPGSQKSTGDMFILEGSEIDIPNVVSKNTNVDAVKRTLDDLAGLTTLDFDTERLGNGFQGRPSFRDMSAFVFQPQNIVANPDVLFYKADTYEHREKLRTIFPYVLGAINPELLAKQHELTQLKKELRRKSAERSNIENVSNRWIAEISSRVSQAREIGLISFPIPENATRQELINYLTDAISLPAESARLSEETLSEALEELGRLRDEEGKLSTEYSGLRRRLSQMTELRKTTSEFQGALLLQRERLQVSEWLHRTHESVPDCPVCGTSLTNEEANLTTLLNSLADIEKSAGSFANVPPAFDREYERVRQDVRDCAEKLEGIKLRRQALERSSDDVRQQQYDSVSVARFIGGTEQALSVYTSLGADDQLTVEIQELEEQIQQLEADISERQVSARTSRALQAVNANVMRLLPLLDVERPNDPVEVILKDLTIKIVGTDREDYLWEIGSGSNWLSYHVAVSLGLQQFFLSLPQTPVPSLVVYDQPSQVYFPRKVSSSSNEEVDPEFTDEDLVAIRRVFVTISQVIREAAGKLQVIVLDHADEGVWGNIPEVNLVAEWRNGEKLIPSSWLEQS